MFAEKSFCPPLTESYLRKQKFTPSAIYELPFKITIEKKLRRFHFKLIQNILASNQPMPLENECKIFSNSANNV